MGVLDARAEAEKVGYPVVGEEVKEASNVIDYNINSEITKDTSAVFNANNDTTTGMATVIPGINAPKLFARTSIYGIEEGGDYAGGVYAKYELASYIRVPGYQEEQYDIKRIYSLTNERGYYTFKYVEGSGLIMPANGTYKLECLYFWGGANTFSVVFNAMVGNKVEHSSQAITYGGGTNETFYVNAQKGKPLWFRLDIENTGATNNIDPEIWCTISKGV